jgi:hypothetical protein
MIHGYKFEPGRGADCPHAHILSLDPAQDQPRVISWPKHLHVGPGHLGIAFGWNSWGSLWRAWGEAERAGIALGRLLNELSAAGRRVDIVAHSLGARVALTGLSRSVAGAVGRAILIAPAEFRLAAEAALTSPAGRTTEVLNVTSHENVLFDGLLEWLIAPHVPGAKTLGGGLRQTAPNWTELRIDDAATLAALASLGYHVAPPVRRICHWSGYLRPGLFPLYRAVLSGKLPIADMVAVLPRCPPRSRFLERLPSRPPLPFVGKAPL